MMDRIRNSESGFVLVMVISLLSVIGILGAAYAGYSYYLVHRTVMLRDNMQTYYGARAGIARAMDEIASGKVQGHGDFTLETMGKDAAMGYLKVRVLYEYSGSSTQGGIRINSYGRIERRSSLQRERMLVAMTDPESGNLKTAWVEEGVPGDSPRGH